MTKVKKYSRLYACACAIAGAFLLTPLAYAQSVNLPPSKELRIEGVIDHFEASKASLLVCHPPTGAIVPLKVTKQSNVTKWVQLDADELAEGTPIALWGRINEKEKTFSGIEVHVLTDGPGTKEGVDGIRIVGRIHRMEPSSSTPRSFFSRDGKTVIALKIGEEIIRLTPTRRLCVFCSQPGSCSDFQPGRQVEVRYRESSGNSEIISAKIAYPFPGGQPYYMNSPGGPSKVTTTEIQSLVTALNPWN
jgi:hypothetical protein